MKSFIFVYMGGVPERTKLTDILNNIPEIYFWRYDTDVCFYILSNSTARQIAESIKRQHPTIGRHIITQLGNEYWGQLTGESWKLLEKHEIPPSTGT